LIRSSVWRWLLRWLPRSYWINRTQTPLRGIAPVT
jgi:hypothetical protein